MYYFINAIQIKQSVFHPLNIFDYVICLKIVYGKNGFAEGSKILLDRSENNFVGTLKIMINAAKNFDTLATSLSILQLF